MKRNLRPLFSSHRQIWRTPKSVFQILDAEFRFEFDPCPQFPGFDGLKKEWGRVNFVNPPFKNISEWMKKGWKEFRLGKTVVFLIPSRTDTKWWHDYVMRSSEIRFIKGRLRFSGSKTNAPFPSAIVVFKNKI
ncbi:hypothetical protein LCGC14_1035870 [marine sediment metagenome]|uniref:Adenine methyltransferase n=1 Tax=marine sediment metagenome TaxID=412755 RepID=A0A0F9NEV1_9ZZZZ